MFSPKILGPEGFGSWRSSNDNISFRSATRSLSHDIDKTNKAEVGTAGAGKLTNLPLSASGGFH